MVCIFALLRAHFQENARSCLFGFSFSCTFCCCCCCYSSLTSGWQKWYRQADQVRRCFTVVTVPAGASFSSACSSCSLLSCSVSTSRSAAGPASASATTPVCTLTVGACDYCCCCCTVDPMWGASWFLPASLKDRREQTEGGSCLPACLWHRFCTQNSTPQGFGLGWYW